MGLESELSKFGALWTKSWRVLSWFFLFIAVVTLVLGVYDLFDEEKISDYDFIYGVVISILVGAFCRTVPIKIFNKFSDNVSEELNDPDNEVHAVSVSTGNANYTHTEIVKANRVRLD